MTDRTITLEPRRYESGEKMRGCFELIVDGSPWGFVTMIGHGCHGNTYRFSDLEHDGVMALDSKGKPRFHVFDEVRGPSRSEARRNPDDKRTAGERIIDKARELIEAGRLRDPAIIAQERAAELAEWRKGREAKDAEKALMRDALIGCWRRGDLTNAEREGLALVFPEIVGGDISVEAAKQPQDVGQEK